MFQNFCKFTAGRSPDLFICGVNGSITYKLEVLEISDPGAP